MLSKLSRFLTIATLTTLTCVITHPANAQSADMEVMTPTSEMETVDSLNVPELINEAYFHNTGDFFEDTGPAGQLNTIFGWGSFPLGSFPENEVTRDGLLIYTIVADYYKQLRERDPILRTRNLVSPFDTSVRDIEMSESTISPEPSPVVETQYQMTEPMRESEPVRGLW